jgi:hypothetical protein
VVERELAACHSAHAQRLVGDSVSDSLQDLRDSIDSMMILSTYVVRVNLQVVVGMRCAMLVRKKKAAVRQQRLEGRKRPKCKRECERSGGRKWPR